MTEPEIVTYQGKRFRKTGEVRTPCEGEHFINVCGLVTLAAFTPRSEVPREILAELPADTKRTHMVNWRKHAEAKAEDLRQLLIELDFRIQDQSAGNCRETICKIEAKTSELRISIAPYD